MQAFRLGAVTVADLIDQLLTTPSPLEYSFEDLRRVSARKLPADLAAYPILKQVGDRCRQRIISISDVGWGMFVNFLDYKLKRKEGRLVEIGRFFPSSKTCSCCGHVINELTLDIREWDCPLCNAHHDRDGNAALNIRNEGLRILSNGEPLAVDGFPGISKVVFVVRVACPFALGVPQA